jgi:hypothetical protein
LAGDVDGRMHDHAHALGHVERQQRPFWIPLGELTDGDGHNGRRCGILNFQPKLLNGTG